MGNPRIRRYSSRRDTRNRNKLPLTMIRKATYDDLPELVRFCFECEATMHCKDHGLGRDVDSAVDLLLRLVGSPDAFLAVVELNGRIEGACAVQLTAYPFNRADIIAVEVILHMRPSFPDGPAKGRWTLKLLDQMRSWSSYQGAKSLLLATRAGHDSLGRALGRRGFKPYESMFMETF